MSREEYVKKTPAERALVHMGAEEDQQPARRVQIWTLRREITALHHECDDHIHKAVNVWKKAVALTALLDAQLKCPTCQGEGKLLRSDEESRRVYGETCDECGGSGEEQTK